MAYYRAQIGFPCDSALPRDVVTINPHYSGDNAQGLADALKANLIAHPPIGASKPFTIKIYDDEAAPPNYPLAQASNGTGFITSTGPREIGMCLSYYATFNRPSFRGRVYIPYTFIGGAMGVRPTSTQRDAVMLWAAVLGIGLPGGTAWGVWSKKNRSFAGVNNVWADDEWDIQRSRGLRPTTRTADTFP